MASVATGLVALQMSFAAHAAGVCTKAEAEKWVNDICKKISEKGSDIQSEWPQGLLFQNCGDNYVWVQDTTKEIKMVMHPIKQRLNGQSLTEHVDENKFHLFIEFDKAAKKSEKGAWVDYMWAKPGAEKATAKTSFVKACKMKNGESWIAGSGVWKEDLK